MHLFCSEFLSLQPGRLFLFVIEGKSYVDAESFCQARDSTLVVVSWILKMNFFFLQCLTPAYHH